MKIRKATAADAKALVDFNQAMAQETENKQLDQAVLSQGVQRLLQNDERGFYMVAEQDGELLGSLMVTYEWSDWQAKDYYWIQSVYIRPQNRRQGIYKRLYQAVQQIAAEAGGAASFRLYVERDNQTAQTTYEALGMAPCQYLMYEQK
ncbi:GNAT family N-acetyltransferase [Shewanella gelidii]|uniref:N-acetyltransferase GCN5 n=1 Tax=Shewanella gelidii TaxID=1642821 RepID=A0A917JRX4_9GAMM|nr:GNAT family N-acetyltransferase [Shewanella gelidii]MCL1097791.1 GNAT family N-acetyltransferase [Shewanella gelidii]GGI78720.1 N-acetyltransferase GCN5 [Shewanella gelidii]